jgi:hypothetical protein
MLRNGINLSLSESIFGVMNKNLKSNERELVKIAMFFKRQSRKLILDGKLGEEHFKVEQTVDSFVEQMEAHADLRAAIQKQRDDLKKLVKDHASCPKCNTSDKLRLVGSEKNEKGWKSNRYRCRKCNTEFTWNRPNNPWDMIKYIEEVMTLLVAKLADPSTPDSEKAQIEGGLATMTANLDRLKPVIEAHDNEHNAMVARDLEMEKLIHEFKNSLLIERIKMDTWENRKSNPDNSKAHGIS